MPRIYKSGKEFKGNENSGDKPDSVKFAKFVNMGLANYVVNDELKDLADKDIGKRDYRKVKDIAVEIAKKGITEKKELTGDLIVQISETIAKKRNIDVAPPETR